MAKDAELTVKIGANSKAFSKELDKVSRDVKKRNTFLDNLDKKQKADFLAREKKLNELKKKLSKETDLKSRQALKRRTSEEKRSLREISALKKKADKERVLLEKKSLQAIEKRNAALLRGATIGFTAVAAGLTLSTRAFMQYETALVGVQKTTDIAGQELSKFKDNIKELSIEMAQNQSELLGIAETAGQLGVRGADNLTKFTKTIAKLNVASKTLQGEAAAEQIARILTITGEGFGDVDRFASVIARLGDNFATSEAAIAEMALSIAQSGGVFKASSTEAAALAAAFAQVGIQPELARSTLLKFGVEMEKTLKNGGDDLKALMAITGQTEDQLKQSFAEKPVEFFQTFLKGLDGVMKGGGSAAETLQQFGLSGLRTLPTLSTLAGANEEVAKSLRLANKEFVENTKLNDEFAKKNELAKTSTQRMGVAITNMGIAIGEVVSPAVVAFADLTTKRFGQLEEGVEALGTIFSGVGTIIAELFNSVLSVIDKSIARVFRNLKELAVFTDDILSKIPKVESPLSSVIKTLEEREVKFSTKGEERGKRSKSFFGAPDTSVTIAQLQAENALFEKQHAQKSKFEQGARDKKLEADRIALAQQEAAQQEALNANKNRAEIAALLDNENRTASEEGHLQSLIKKEQAEVEAEQRKVERAELSTLLANENRTIEEESDLQSLLAKEANEIEADERKLERETEKREAKLELEQEQFDQDLETLNERLAEEGAAKDVFAGQDIVRELAKLKGKAKNSKDIEKIDKSLSEAQQKFSTDALKTQVLNLDQLFGAETAVGKAIFLARKAQLIAETIASTQASMALARATVPPPAGDVVAARYGIAGAINVGVIAGTAISGAKDGGMVHGGVFGRDTEPFLLAKGEAIVPSKLNPLSTDFEGEFGEGGLGGSQNVQVEISLTDDAARFITAGQREDSALGV